MKILGVHKILWAHHYYLNYEIFGESFTRILHLYGFA